MGASNASLCNKKGVFGIRPACLAATERNSSIRRIGAALPQLACPGWASSGGALPRSAQHSPSSVPALRRPLYVTVVYRGKCSHCMRIGVAVPVCGTVARLREAVSSETKIPTEQVTSWSHHPRTLPSAGECVGFRPALELRKFAVHD